MIILVGESGCGKSTIEKLLVERYGYKKTISYTTRPPRENEVDGVDYYFISQDEFIEKNNNDFFVEIGSYNGWFYGSTKDQYEDNTVCVLTPHGLRQIRQNLKKDMLVVYLKVSRKERMIRCLQRGDDVDEVIRRSQTEIGQFDGILDEVDKAIPLEYIDVNVAAQRISELERKC